MVDGTTVYTRAGGTPFNQVSLSMSGPTWRPAWTSYFDDFQFTPFGEPDLAVTQPSWNITNGGLDYGYTISGADLQQPTTIDLDWASGTTPDSIIGNPADHDD